MGKWLSQDGDDVLLIAFTFFVVLGGMSVGFVFLLIIKLLPFSDCDPSAESVEVSSASSVFSLLLSGSSYANTREEAEPGLYEVGGWTQLGFFVTRREA